MIKITFQLLILFTITIHSKGIDATFTSDGKIVDDVLTILGLNAKGYNNSYALVIGISKYHKKSNFQELPTKNDPIRMKDYLINQAGFEYVHLLTEDKVTLSRVRELMSEVFPTKLRKNDRFLFYWSGHGLSYKLPRGGYKGFLPLALTENEKKYSSMLSMNNIKEWDEQLNAKQTLYVLDSCFSGLAGNIRKNNYEHKLTFQQLSKPSRHILSAGTGIETTIASDKFGGSIFTSALLDGLISGKADNSTFKKDGILTISELLLYIRDYVKIKKDNWQKSITPQLRDLELNEGEFFFFIRNEDKLNNHGTNNFNELKLFGELSEKEQQKTINFMKKLKEESKSIKTLQAKVKIQSSNEELLKVENTSFSLFIDSLTLEQTIKYNKYLSKSLEVSSNHLTRYSLYRDKISKSLDVLRQEESICRKYKLLKDRGSSKFENDYIACQKTYHTLKINFIELFNSFDRISEKIKIIVEQIDKIKLKKDFLHRYIRERKKKL